MCKATQQHGHQRQVCFECARMSLYPVSTYLNSPGCLQDHLAVSITLYKGGKGLICHIELVSKGRQRGRGTDQSTEKTVFRAATLLEMSQPASKHPSSLVQRVAAGGVRWAGSSARGWKFPLGLGIRQHVCLQQGKSCRARSRRPPGSSRLPKPHRTCNGSSGKITQTACKPFLKGARLRRQEAGETHHRTHQGVPSPRLSRPRTLQRSGGAQGCQDEADARFWSCVPQE